MEASREDERSSRAVILYLGAGRGMYPRKDEQAVIDEFGQSEGRVMLAYAGSIVEEMNGVDIDWSAHSLNSATDLYVQDVRDRHPELSEAAVEILANAFSFWFK